MAAAAIYPSAIKAVGYSDHQRRANGHKFSERLSALTQNGIFWLKWELPKNLNHRSPVNMEFQPVVGL